MNINVYIEDSLAMELKEYIKHTGKQRNTIIREAIKEWLSHHQTTQWPASIKKFNGIPDAPAFESTRQELSDTDEDPLA